MLFLELRQAGKPEQELRDAPLQAVFDYFAGEVLRRLDSETRDVLFMTALLPMTTATLAEQLTGCARTAQILEQLYRSNYFTLRDGQAEPGLSIPPAVS